MTILSTQECGLTCVTWCRPSPHRKRLQRWHNNRAQRYCAVDGCWNRSRNCMESFSRVTHRETTFTTTLSSSCAPLMPPPLSPPLSPPLPTPAPLLRHSWFRDWSLTVGRKLITVWDSRSARRVQSVPLYDRIRSVNCMRQVGFFLHWHLAPPPVHSRGLFSHLLAQLNRRQQHNGNHRGFAWQRFTLHWE